MLKVALIVSVGLVVQHAMTSHFKKTAIIIDSGATCHMCNDKSAFVKYGELKIPLEVKLGSGYKVDITGNGTIILSGKRNTYIMFCMCPDCLTTYLRSVSKMR